MDELSARAGKEQARLSTGGFLLMCVGMVFGAELAFSWYIQLLNADESYQPNMAPERFVFFAPFFALLTVPGALFAEAALFWWSRTFRWHSVWFIVGISYGLFWSNYGFAVVLKSPGYALLCGACLSLGSVLIVRLLANWLARRVVS